MGVLCFIGEAGEFLAIPKFPSTSRSLQSEYRSGKLYHHILRPPVFGTRYVSGRGTRLLPLSFQFWNGLQDFGGALFHLDDGSAWRSILANPEGSYPPRAHPRCDSGSPLERPPRTVAGAWPPCLHTTAHMYRTRRSFSGPVTPGTLSPVGRTEPTSRSALSRALGYSRDARSLQDSGRNRDHVRTLGHLLLEDREVWLFQDNLTRVSGTTVPTTHLRCFVSKGKTLAHIIVPHTSLRERGLHLSDPAR